MKSIITRMLAAVLATVIIVVPLAASAAPAPNATINITVDDEYELYVNGNLIGQDKGQNKWQAAENWPVYLDENSVIAVRANDAYRTIAGMSLTITYDDARPAVVASAGTGWLVRPGFDSSWLLPGYVPGIEWTDVHNISPNNSGWNSNLGMRQWVWTSKYLYSSTSGNFDALVTFRFTASAPIPFTHEVTFVDGMDVSHVYGTETVNSGETATEPADPTKEGYRFVGWFLPQAETEFAFSTPITGDITLQAMWEAPWTVTFDSMGGSTVASQSVYTGEMATEPADPSMDGYTFAGWYPAESDELFDFSTPITDNITLYAEWDVAPWTVTFDSAGGSAVASQSVDDGDMAAEPDDPTREGFTFAGWYPEESDELFDFSTPITDNVTLYAEWDALPGSWTVTFDSTGGSAVASQSVEDGDMATEPDDPNREDFTFEGWYPAESNEPFDFATPITDDITLYAMWSEVIIDYYTVTYLPGSQGTFGSQLTAGLLAGTTTPGAPTVTGAAGWVFAGWSPTVTPTVEGNATYTAQWQPQETPPPPPQPYFDVVANAEAGGSASGGGTFLPGLFTTVAATEDDGFTFIGWFENDILVSSDASYNFQVLGDRVLVAKFDPIPVATFYDVTASAGIGGSATGGGNFLAGSSATVIATPEDGYEFLGWFENGVLVSSSTVYTVVVDRDYVLAADFELELIDEPVVPGAPELPETGATPFTFFYVFGAALGAAGISLGRKRSR